MKIRSTSNVWEDSGIDELLAESKLSSFFKVRDYGNSEVELFYLITVTDNEFNPKPRYDSREKVLYWDIVLSYTQIKSASDKERKFILATAIIDSFYIIDKYNKARKLHIDRQKIQEDAKFYFEGIEWL